MAKATKVKDETIHDPASMTPITADQLAQLPSVVPPPASAPPAPAQGLASPPPVAHGLPVTAIADLAGAIASITHEIADQKVVKRGHNKFHNYKYAAMQDILSALSPLMSKHGVVIMQNEVERGFADGERSTVYATYEFTIFHKSGNVWPEKQKHTGWCRAKDSKGGFDDKAMNKCHTAARKYFLLALFQIPTEEEHDADRGDNDGGGQRRAPPPQEQAREPVREAFVKLEPQTLPTENTTFAKWAGVYIPQINACDEIVALGQWRALNADALALMQEKGPKIYEKVVATEKDRRDEIEAAEAVET